MLSIKDASVYTITSGYWSYQSIVPPAGAVPGQIMIVSASSYNGVPSLYGENWRRINALSGSYMYGATWVKRLEASDFDPDAIQLYAYFSTGNYAVTVMTARIVGAGDIWASADTVASFRDGAYSYLSYSEASTTLAVESPANEMLVYLLASRSSASYYALTTAPSVDRGALLTSRVGVDTNDGNSAAIYWEKPGADLGTTIATVTIPAYRAADYFVVLRFGWPSVVGTRSDIQVRSGAGYGLTPATPGMEILDPDLLQAPTSVTVVLNNVTAGIPIDFLIDGVDVYQADGSEDSWLGPTSIPVDEIIGTAGTHTLTATQNGQIIASGTFAIELDNFGSGTTGRGADADPVAVPGAITAHGTRKWVLQDLTAGGLGSYVMPINPAEMDPPEFQRPLSAQHTTAIDGQYHVYEGSTAPVEWSFSGHIPTQDMHDKLMAFANLNRRFYLIDHRNRAWKVAIAAVDMVPRLRSINLYGEMTDSIYDYTMTALIYDQEWMTPQ